MKFFITAFLSLFTCLSFAQDAYHSELNTSLMTEYNLPTANWLMADTETGIFAGIQSYGCSVTSIDAIDQDFSKISQAVVSSAGGNPWDSGWKTLNSSNVASGDKILLVFWLRSEGGTNGKANIFVENNSTFEKEVYVPVNISQGWTQYFVPFEASISSYSTGQLALGFHLANQVQTIQIGGFTAINYGSAISLDDLPADIAADQYEGYEADAPWRTDAAERIESLRKTNLSINAETTDGAPVSGALFKVDMISHEFAFGSAVTASRLAGNNDYNVFYENKIANLDGNGHGFNWVVFENDLKWDGWEEMWFVNHDELVNAVGWLYDRDIKIRGHNLVWPGFGNMPDDIAANSNDTDYIWNRVNGRLEEILQYPGLEVDKIPEWDVLNEIVTNTSLEAPFSTVPGNTTGREVYADIFKRAREISPDTKLYINDYVTISVGNTGGGQYDALKNKIQELLDADAPVDGIGFQGHVGGFPNGINEVKGVLDDFYDTFGLKAKITEFDMPPSISEELGATYLRDFLTMTFSHPSTDGFLFWNFWDGATWQNPGTNLFRDDWSRTPAGDTFVAMVFDEWWTSEELGTEANGTLDTRVFKGLHTITYECNGETVVDTINLVEDQNLTIVCNDFQITGIADLTPNELAFKVVPNPVHEMLTITKPEEGSAQLTLYNAIGISVLEKTVSGSQIELLLEEAPGIYYLELVENGRKGFQKVIIH